MSLHACMHAQACLRICKHMSNIKSNQNTKHCMGKLRHHSPGCHTTFQLQTIPAELLWRIISSTSYSQITSQKFLFSAAMFCAKINFLTRNPTPRKKKNLKPSWRLVYKWRKGLRCTLNSYLSQSNLNQCKEDQTT